MLPRTRLARLAAAVVLGAVATAARADDAPRLASPAAVVLHAATGDEIFARRADEVRPIASLTKIFVAMVLRRHRVDLERWTEIDAGDARASAGGTHTLLLEGQTFQNRDLLYAMLLSSDNRVPSALARSIGLSGDELIAELGRVAGDLGLSHTHFDDATGIHGNASTARALALREILRDRLLARIMTTQHARVVSRSGDITASYTSTVRPLRDRRYKILGGKTGRSEGAGCCSVIAVKAAGRPRVMALLGGKTQDARFDDFAAVMAWLNVRGAAVGSAAPR